MKMNQWSLAILLLSVLTLNYSNARGAAKGNSMYGDGNVLANTYCQYKGLDCSSTCCIQQSCAASLTDCEYGITTDMLYLYYIAAGIIGLIFLLPLIVKIMIVLLTWKVITQKKVLPNDRTEIIKISCLELMGMYCCCFLICCYKSQKDKERLGGKDGLANIRFKSQYMEDLEKHNFNIDSTYADEYLKGASDTTKTTKEKLVINKQEDGWDLEPSRRSDEENYENWNVAELKDKIDEKSLSVSSSRFEFLHNKNGMEGAGTMTPQYYSKNHSERKINEKEENIENKNYLNPKEQIKKGRQSKIKENPDSLDSDLMEAILKSHDQKVVIDEPEKLLSNSQDNPSDIQEESYDHQKSKKKEESERRKSVESIVSDKMMDEILKWDEEKEKIEEKTKKGKDKGKGKKKHEE